LPPPCPNSLLELSPPSAYLPDTFMDALDEPGHLQQPVYRGNEFTPSVQPSIHSQTPSSTPVFHTAPSSMPTSVPPSSSPYHITLAAPSYP